MFYKMLRIGFYDRTWEVRYKRPDLERLAWVRLLQRVPELLQCF